MVGSTRKQNETSSAYPGSGSELYIGHNLLSSVVVIVYNYN